MTSVKNAAEYFSTEHFKILLASHNECSMTWWSVPVHDNVILGHSYFCFSETPKKKIKGTKKQTFNAL